MLNKPLQLLFSKKRLKQLQKISTPAIKLAGEVRLWSDDQLKAEFHTIKGAETSNLPKALAMAREAARRTLGLEPYLEQLQGAAALFHGVVVEMKTGEGKTLTVGLAAAIAAIAKQGVHVATVNAYLAQRDAETLKPLYSFLGLSVGVTLPGQTTEEKQIAYQCDITYGVHSELGFDYLRDNLVPGLQQQVQRKLAFAIVDEADSILIDEARTPLVISQAADTNIQVYKVANDIAMHLNSVSDYVVDEKTYQATLSELGLDKVESLLMSKGLIPHKGALYETSNIHLLRYLTAALKAHSLYRVDRDYIVQQGEVKIIDGGTGRILEGRQWQGGLHQAIETKEHVDIKPENETAAEITYQSFFRLYRKLAGLTGTAQAASEELETMYGLTVVQIPTHLPVIRKDFPDQVFRSKLDKFQAIVADVQTRKSRGQPILIGTASVRESDELSYYLTSAGITHSVLNARDNDKEADIIAEAGMPGSVTVATNMAGRGTDIVLGGHTAKD